MKKLIIAILLLKCLFVTAQIQLSDDYKRFNSEQFGRGHGFTNNVYTFYIEAERGDEEYIFSTYYRTKDNLYIATGKLYYTIYIPEKHEIVKVHCQKPEKLFSYYSKLLLKTIRQNRYNKRNYFEKANGK